jgi:hypothetical protein
MCLSSDLRHYSMRLTANCETVIACVHAHPPGTAGAAPPLAALLDINSGEGGSVRDVAVLEDEVGGGVELLNPVPP